METKLCPSCRCEQPVGNFYRNRNICKLCDKRKSRERYQANREELSQVIRARRFGMTVDQLAAFLAPGCSICGSHEDVVVDHDHGCCDRDGSCGECLRGPLCRNHNRGLAYFEQSPGHLEEAMNYLRKWTR
jgi:hypothetical protein